MRDGECGRSWALGDAGRERIFTRFRRNARPATKRLARLVLSSVKDERGGSKRKDKPTSNRVQLESNARQSANYQDIRDKPTAGAWTGESTHEVTLVQRGSVW